MKKHNSCPLRLDQITDCPRHSLVQLPPNITELCPAMVPCCYSNFGPQVSKAYLSLILGFYIQKLIIALNWVQLNFQFFLSYSQTQLHSILNFVISLIMAISYTIRCLVSPNFFSMLVICLKKNYSLRIIWITQFYLCNQVFCVRHHIMQFETLHTYLDLLYKQC